MSEHQIEVPALEKTATETTEDRQQQSERREGMQVDFDVRSVHIKEQGDSKKSILQNVRGTALKGEVLSIMGPSGAGKSTLVSIAHCFSSIYNSMA